MSTSPSVTLISRFSTTYNFLWERLKNLVGATLADSVDDLVVWVYITTGVVEKKDPGGYPRWKKEIVYWIKNTTVKAFQNREKIMKNSNLNWCLF